MEMSLLQSQTAAGIESFLASTKYECDNDKLHTIEKFLLSCCEQIKQPCAYHFILKINVFALANMTQVTDYLRRSLPCVMWLWSKEHSKNSSSHVHLVLVVDNKLTYLFKVYRLRKSLETAFSVKQSYGGFIESVTLAPRKIDSKSYYHILKSNLEDAMIRYSYLAKLDQKKGVKEQQTFGYSRKATTTHSAWH